MRIKYKTHRLKTLISIELLLIAVAVLIAASFWQNVCAHSLRGCLGTETALQMPRFLLLAIIRPFVFTPISLLPRDRRRKFRHVVGCIAQCYRCSVVGIGSFF